jgi:pyroglutamyl-peptidase
MTVRLLLTGFDPFGSHAANPSERLVRRLASCAPAGSILSTRILPVNYASAFQAVRDVLDSERVHGALMLGLGAGRHQIDFERLAVNWRGGALQDNEGRRIEGEQIDPGGPAAYFSTVPLEEMVAACDGVGVPSGVSSHAGTFLCNQVLYQALRHCDVRALRSRVGFAHVPLTPDLAQPGEPNMTEEAMFCGIAAALARLAELPQADAIRDQSAPDD